MVWQSLGFSWPWQGIISRSTGRELDVVKDRINAATCERIHLAIADCCSWCCCPSLLPLVEAYCHAYCTLLWSLATADCHCQLQLSYAPWATGRELSTCPGPPQGVWGAIPFQYRRSLGGGTFPQAEGLGKQQHPLAVHGSGKCQPPWELLRAVAPIG